MDGFLSSYGMLISPFIFGDSFSCHNLNFLDPISEKDLSNEFVFERYKHLVIPWIIAQGPRPKNDKFAPAEIWDFSIIL